ncbi:hypothetical protein [Micromonospora sp. HUAS LYJ1]|uniref:hypothetical protein n=1 Tax=Micromonospora sp. HUAS LYJ1 TaxID=3061626 RepID=UPI002671EFBE|nr:hypothetical protein [Micromonospora sp. HUAS LYJ1]WKU03427.1 hypothetical protein Q2K16_21570 [Micromonospora sp. HUAS LYJ1]
MSTHCYIGAITPENPQRVQARVVLNDGRPAAVLPALATIWARHAHRNTQALITTILAHDWEQLDPDVTVSPLARQQRMPGVGILNSTTAPEPVTVFPLCHAQHLDAPWIYLMHPDIDTVTVHTTDGTRVATYPLRWCLPATGTPDNQSRPAPLRSAR